jgi:predicted ATPase
VIARRLSGLSEKTIQVLTRAAVLGGEFDVAALESLTGRPSDELLETLDEAVVAKIVRRSYFSGARGERDHQRSGRGLA